jgi:DNA repair photolyase
MKRFTGHREPWGEFVVVRINAPELLRAEVRKKKKGRVWVSGVCDLTSLWRKDTGSREDALRSWPGAAGR